MLQLLNSETNVSEISLEKIGELHIQLINVHPYDITLYESAFHYYDSVMDDSENASRILKEGILKIQERCEKIKQLVR